MHFSSGNGSSWKSLILQRSIATSEEDALDWGWNNSRTSTMIIMIIITIISISQQRLLAKLASKILSLRIKTGRYKGISVEQWYCQVCNSTDVEGEMHFLCTCHLLTNIRESYLADLYKDSPHFQEIDKIELLKMCLTSTFIKKFRARTNVCRKYENAVQSIDIIGSCDDRYKHLH